MDRRIALVTGAGRGIGRAIATTMQAGGARVIGVSRTEDELARVAAEAGIEYVVGSVDSPEGCLRIVDEVRRRAGPIDILINNAGLGGAYRESPIWSMTTTIWRETMATNLDGPFELTRLVVPHMIEKRWGRIIMIGSLAGTRGGAGIPGYAASKAGLIGFMRAVAQDLAPYAITCNAVLPGWVQTHITEKAAEAAGRSGVSPESFWKARAEASPAGRIVSAEEVARVVAFVASDEASGITGETIAVTLGLP